MHCKLQNTILVATILLVPILLACGQSDIYEFHAVLLRCGDQGLDGKLQCVKPLRMGAEEFVRVNIRTQKVQAEIVRQDPENPSLEFIDYDDCSVFDSENWHCGLNSERTEIKNIHGMTRGRYYTELYGGVPPDYYYSSIGGWRYWLVHWGLVSWQHALSI